MKKDLAESVILALTPEFPQHSTMNQSEESSIYGPVFWSAYCANFLLGLANALTFHFAEFVRFLNGTEKISGAIVSAGLIGAILSRLVLGPALDRFGVRLVWLALTGGLILGAALFLTVHRIDVWIYLSRVIFAASVSGLFTVSNAHIQNHVPENRRTEAIGALGSSGFLGLIVGSQLGDLLYNRWPQGELRYQVLFGTVVIIGLAYGLVVAMVSVTGREQHVATERVWPVIVRHWPLWTSTIAVGMGLVFAVTTVFLTRYATTEGLGGISTFFTGYAGSAFLVRLLTRAWSSRFGRHRLIVAGLSGHVLGLTLLPTVTSEWLFLLPSFCCGFGHALLFPSVVSLGAGVFPPAYRGTGTTLILGFVDLGTVLGAPLLGWVIDHLGYRTMFWTAATLTGLIVAAYTWTHHHQFDTDSDRRQPELAVDTVANDEYSS